jgi:hypothetical protein
MSLKWLIWRRELYALEAVIQVKWIWDREEAFGEGWAVVLSDHFFVIMRAFLAGPEKTPAKMDGTSLISFEDDTEYVLFIEKKLQSKCFMVDLIGFSFGKVFHLHGVRNHYSGCRLSIK